MADFRTTVKHLLQLAQSRWRILAAVGLVVLVVGVNGVAWLHARAMTRFVRSGERTASPEKLGATAKLRVLLTGVTLVRPENRKTPRDAGLEYQPIRFPAAKGIELEAWFVRADGGGTNGIVLLFHGYGASKESLLPQAAAFHALGWDTMLVDFHGSGGSAGDTTSVGWHEAADVEAAFTKAAELAPGTRRILYGVSMGAAACLRAVHVHGVKPDALIVECPFDRMLTTVQRRFHAMKVPAWPLADLLVFWGGRHGGFDASAHNPVNYAASVHCPTLVMHGEKDRRVSVDEVQTVHAALAGPKSLKIFPSLGHQSYIEADPEGWLTSVRPLLAGKSDAQAPATPPRPE